MQLQLPPSVLLLLSLVAFNCKLVTPNVVLHNHVSKENIHNRSQIKGCKSPIQHYNLFGIPGDGYYVAAQIGTPPQNVNLLVDTGSSNLAVAGSDDAQLETYFVSDDSNTFSALNDSVKVVYAQGWWEGPLGRDVIVLPNLACSLPTRADVALIKRSHSFYVPGSHWQGILGLAFPELAQPNSSVQPWFDALLASVASSQEPLVSPFTSAFKDKSFSPNNSLSLHNSSAKSKPSAMPSHDKHQSTTQLPINTLSPSLVSSIQLSHPALDFREKNGSQILPSSNTYLLYDNSSLSNASSSDRKVIAVAINKTSNSNFKEKKSPLYNGFGLELCGPWASEQHDVQIGRIMLGDSVSSCGTGPWFESPILQPWFYEVAVVAMAVDETPLGLPCALYNAHTSIVDSGTTKLKLPHRVLDAVIASLESVSSERLQEDLPKGFWRGEGKVCWSDAHEGWSLLPTLSIDIAMSNNSVFRIALGPMSYLRPYQNETQGSNLASLKPSSGEGEGLFGQQVGEVGNPHSNGGKLQDGGDLPCWVPGLEKSNMGTVLGVVALEGLCTWFDRGRGLVSFRKSECGPPVQLSGPHHHHGAGSCAKSTGGSAVGTAVLAVLLAVLCCPLLVYGGRWLYILARKSSHQSGAVDTPFLSLDENTALG